MVHLKKNKVECPTNAGKQWTLTKIKLTSDDSDVSN